MRIIGWFLSGLVGVTLTVPAAAQSAEFYPLELVKPGQKGYGKTIFSGSQIEKFDVEIIGVLDNFGPKQHMILARLSGEKVEVTGVFGGMSGSPVYLEERLLGAIAFSFPFSKEPLAGITPIQEMVDVFKTKPPLVRRSSGGAGLARIRRARDGGLDALESLQMRAATMEVGGRGHLRPIATPLNLSGFSDRSLQPFASTFRSLGLVPVRGLASASGNDYPREPIQPGSSVSVQLVRGDMEVGATGTVTHISGNKLYAFGHPFLSVGKTELPMSQAAVISVIASLQSSQKVSATQGFIGSIRQDRSTGIYGILGEEPKMMPVQLKLRSSRNQAFEYNYEVALDSFLTPFLINLTVNNAILASERSLGGQTLRVSCDITLKDHPKVVYESTISRQTSTPALAAVTLSAPIDALLDSGFNLEIEKVEFKIDSVEETRRTRLLKVWQDKLEVRAGEELELTLFLRRDDGETRVEKHTIKIPEGLPPGPLKIAVGDGVSLSRSESDSRSATFIPENAGQLIRAINNLKTNNRLYVRLFRTQSGAVIGGEGMPDLPPSLLALFSSKKTSGDVRSIDRVVYFEHELPATDQVLTGRKVIEINVKS